MTNKIECYAIGEYVDGWKYKYGPEPNLDALLDEVGDRGEYILGLFTDAEPTMLYRWNDSKLSWTKAKRNHQKGS